jgi:hypothetical protein
LEWVGGKSEDVKSLRRTQNWVSNKKSYPPKKMKITPESEQ